MHYLVKKFSSCTILHYYIKMPWIFILFENSENGRMIKLPYNINFVDVINKILLHLQFSFFMNYFNRSKMPRAPINTSKNFWKGTTAYLFLDFIMLLEFAYFFPNESRWTENKRAWALLKRLNYLFSLWFRTSTSHFCKIMGVA